MSNVLRNHHSDSSERQKSIYLKIHQYHCWAYTQRMLLSTTGHLVNHICCCCTHTNQKWQRTLIYFKRKIDLKNVEHLNTEHYSVVFKKNWKAVLSHSCRRPMCKNSWTHNLGYHPCPDPLLRVGALQYLLHLWAAEVYGGASPAKPVVFID